MGYSRILDLSKQALKKSLFLFGPRQTGKTSLLKKQFPHSPYYNLLLADEFLRLSGRPQTIREELLAKSSVNQPIIIDEIQKLPLLLDEVHHLIEEKGFRFILTGSSQRKLKRGGANLLGGRARTRHLFPLVTPEIPNYDLLKILNFGAIPSIYDSDEPWEDLASYVGHYLQEEIQAEGAVRRIENFSRFLPVAGFFSSELVNYANVASDTGLPARTVAEYFSILKDTLVGAILEPYRKSKKAKLINTAKFYFFDVGVANFLAGRRHIKPRTELFGKALEHFIFTELRAWQSYTRDERPLSFLASHSGFEVDFLIGDQTAIEVKGTEGITERHLTQIARAAEEMTLKHQIVVSMDPNPRKIGKILVLPVKNFLEKLWAGDF